MSKPQCAFRRTLGVMVLSVTVVAASIASAQTAKAPPAAAQAAGALPIAVLSMQRVLRETAAGKSAAQQVGEMQAKGLHEHHVCELLRNE